MEYVDLDHLCPDLQLLRVLPERKAREYGAVILGRRSDGPGLRIGMCDPGDVVACDRIAQFLQQDLEVVQVDAAAFFALLDRHYPTPDAISGHARQVINDLETAFDPNGGRASQPLSTSDDPSDAESPTLLEILGRTGTTAIGGREDVPRDGADSDPPVARLLRAIITQASASNASDVHIEPGTDALRVRLRVDGALQEQTIDDPRVGRALISHLKLLSGLDIAERRLPQDGHFPFRIDSTLLDVRLATIPLAGGEGAVLRLLDQADGLRDFSRLGMPEPIGRRLRGCLQREDGLILVTGPTGSGKTTTVYSAIAELNAPERKIVTAEDPIEYCLPGVNQVQVQPLIGLDFARVLRALLRHDPDVVAVGEIRDAETASIALRAAMTGHLVLSTLHTRDAISAMSRLIDLGCEGFLIAETLRAVIAQRLVRRICPHCLQRHDPDPDNSAWLHEHGLASALGDHPLYRGSGCRHCRQTGYLGRIGVYELFEPDERVRWHLHRGDLHKALDTARRSGHVAAFTDAAVELAQRGMTSLNEVMRIAQDQTEYRA